MSTDYLALAIYIGLYICGFMAECDNMHVKHCLSQPKQDLIW